MLRIAYKNLGCKVNAYELNKIREELLEFGFLEVDFDDVADIYIINTCSVTHIADKKSRQMIHKSKKNNKKALVIAMGCSIDNDTKVLKNESDDYVFLKNADKKNIKNIVKNYLISKNILYNKIDKTNNNVVNNNQHRVRAYIKIEDGCNQFCSYCIIPYLRGSVKSKPIDIIVNEVKDFAKDGIVEVILTGINISSYSLDFYGLNYEDNNAIDISRKNLIDLINKIYNIDSIKRIRLSSIEPRLISKDFIDKLYILKDKFCDEFHLSLQSGCDKILKLMNRRYDTAMYCDAINIIRDKFVNASITTDIIVGFPFETDDDFNITCKFCEKVKFYNPHIFKYSRRFGTVAYGMNCQVKDIVKNERSKILIDLTTKISNEIRNNYINKEQEILIESISSENNKIYLQGFTKNYISTKVILDNDSEQINVIGNVIKVKILQQQNSFLCAKII